MTLPGGIADRIVAALKELGPQSVVDLAWLTVYPLQAVREALPRLEQAGVVVLDRVPGQTPMWKLKEKA